MQNCTCNKSQDQRRDPKMLTAAPPGPGAGWVPLFTCNVSVFFQMPTLDTHYSYSHKIIVLKESSNLPSPHPDTHSPSTRSPLACPLLRPRSPAQEAHSPAPDQAAPGHSHHVSANPRESQWIYRTAVGGWGTGLFRVFEIINGFHNTQFKGCPPACLPGV